ncbi:hypothetical protein [Methylobacterium planeticum]|uniref:Uncharacterized protein n=1 Tax=Methylobacterium planeticum TaxID=2615211 RepID=A0A6N6MJG4_9HYPH|nr:hypothetical protein [Methylobacterium planeticum]KAB1070208.1 hypothetical protein F6X51_23275 [Methylobacterium planeticum]
MLFDERRNSDLLFSAADERWRAEVMRRFGGGRGGADPGAALHRGEPGSYLRKTFDARERTYRRWLQVRGLGDFRLCAPAHRPEPLDFVALFVGRVPHRHRPDWH